MVKRLFSFGEKKELSLFDNYIAFLNKYRSKKANILILGCGYNAKNLFYFKKLFPNWEFTGIDIKINPALPKNDKLHLIEADIENWEPSKKYNFIISMAVLEHLQDPKCFFQLLYKAIKPKGYSFITTPLPFSDLILSLLGNLKIIDKEECEDHKIYFTKYGLINLIHKAKLKMIEYKAFCLGLNQLCVISK